MLKDERILSLFIILILLTASLAVPGAVLATGQDQSDSEVMTLPDLETSGVIRVDSDDELAAVSDSGSGTVADPYVIENKRIDASGQGAGIYVRNTTKALIIRNCWVSNAVYVDPNWGPGANIMVYSDGPCQIENNRCDNNSGDGLKLAVTNSRITGNTIWGTQNGMNIVSSTYCSIDNNTITGTSWTGISVIMASEQNLVANNTIINCYQGINLYAQGNDNFVRDNQITGGEIGILADYGNRNNIRENFISSASHGIEIRDSTGNLVENNEMTNNIFHLFLRRASENMVVNNTCRFGATGLEMYDAPCYNNTIEGNLFEGGSNFGILIAPSGSGVHQNNEFTNNTFLEAHSQGVYIIAGGNSGNVFLNNAFIGCNGGATQAADFSYNIWNNASSGNYWHDHRSPDDNDDGIVDIAYTIQSNTLLYDQYPLTSPLHITSPANMSEVDTSSVTLSGSLINHHDIASFTWYNIASNETGNVSGLTLWTAEIGLVPGVNDIHVGMTDSDGRTFEDNVTLSCTALILTVDPEEGSTTYTSSTKYNITVDAAGYPGLADIYVVLRADYIGFGYRLGADPVGAKTYHGTFELDLYDGLNQVWVFVNDTAGHMAMCSLGLFMDFYPPAIEFTYLPEGSYLNDDPVEITWTFVQEPPMIPYSPISETYYSMDGADWTRTYNGSVIFPGLTDGGHYFRIKGVDMAGNVGVNGVNFTLDTCSPYLKITSPAKGTMFGWNDITVEYTAYDALTGLDYLQYRLDTGAWTDLDAVNITFADLPDGLHILYMRTADLAGNMNSTSISFTVDTTAPVVTITAPNESGYVKNGLVTWTVNDVSSVDMTEVSTDGLNWTVVSGTSHTFTLADGTHTVHVRVRDQVGLVGSDSVTFTIDTTAPVLLITSPTEGSYNNTGSVILKWTASDTNGIVKTEVSKDGSAWTTVTGLSSTVSGLTDGPWTIHVRVTDPAGNSVTDSVLVKVSVSGPSIEMAPEDTVYTDDDRLFVTANISDEVPMTDAVLRVFVGGEMVSEVDLGDQVQGDLAASLSYEIGLTEGVNVIKLTVNDSAGNSVTVEVTVVMDTMAPTLSIGFPTEGALLNVTQGIAQWTASDDGSGLNNTWVRMDEGDWIELGSAEGWIFTSLVDGEHRLFVKVDDQAGNSVEKNVTFVVDTAAPTAEVSPTGTGNALNSTVVIEFSEQMNITSVDVAIEGASGNVTWNGTVLTFNPSALEYARDYRVTVSGKDLAGNAMEMNWSFSTTTGTGSVTGTLVDEDGEPLANITVRVGDRSAVTNELGRFVLSDVPPGNYVLTVEAEGYEMLTEMVSVTAGDSEELGELTLVAEDDGEGTNGGNGTLLIIIAVVAIIALAGAAAVILLKRKP